MRLVTILVTIVTLATAEAGLGVTPVHREAGEPVGTVTTTAATRARAEVDIRRIRSMVSADSARAVDEAIARLERLEKRMRGK